MKTKKKLTGRQSVKWLVALCCSVLLSGGIMLAAYKQQDVVSVYAEESDVTDFVSRLYTVILERTPDEAGLAEWSGWLLDGTFTGAEVAEGFIMSDEFLGKEMTNEDFVQILYQAFFGREADPSGLATWVDFLDQGYRKSYVFAGFANSTEFGTLCGSYGVEAGSVPVTISEQQPNLSDEEYNVWLFVERMYTEVLNRTPDMLGIQEWVGYLQNGTFTGAEVASGFILSNEFQNKDMTNKEYVQIMYRAFFGREADEGGLASWTEALENGYTKRFVFAGFANSVEFGGLCENYGITRGEIQPMDAVPETPYEAVNVENGICVSWNATEDVTHYGVWRSETGADGTYLWLDNVEGTSYTDESVVSRTVYYYKLTAYDAIMQIHGELSGEIGTAYVDVADMSAANRADALDVLNILVKDDSRWGMWDLTYLEFLEMYWSIGTENDLFATMLKEKGPRHTDPTIWFEYDGVANLEISFPDVLTEKVYALHYAPFEYNFADFESGNYGKGTVESYQDHGGVCSILARTYRHFIKDILGETNWTYCNYGNDAVNHEVLLVKTEDGRVFQADNCGVDYWWLGLEFTPDYSKYECEETSDDVVSRFATWKEDFAALEKVYWHTFSIVHDYDWDVNAWNRRPVWYDYETGEFTTYLDAGVPKYYKVTFRGLQDKVISMAGNTRLDGYVDLDELTFE